jgi:hypothetical protein
VGGGGVDRDEKVKQRDDGGGISKVVGGGLSAGGGDEERIVGEGLEGGDLFGTRAALEGNELNVGNFGEGGKQSERQGTEAIPLVVGIPLPTNADAKGAWSVCREALGPKVTALRFRLEVGRGCGDSLERSIENPRQGHQGRGKVSERQGRFRGKKLIDARNGGEQAEERGRALEDDVGAAFLGEACIADEVDGVAEAGVGRQKKAASGERLTCPKREGVWGMRDVGGIEIEVLPGVLESAKGKESQGTVAAGTRMGGIEFEGEIEDAKRLVVMRGHDAEARTVVVRADEEGIEAQRLEKSGVSVSEAAELAVNQAKVVVKTGVSGGNFQGAKEKGDGIVRAFDGDERVAEGVEGLHRVGREGQRLPKERESVLEAAVGGELGGAGPQVGGGIWSGGGHGFARTPVKKPRWGMGRVAARDVSV